MTTIGVVMAVYDGVRPDHLADALLSLDRQSRRPDELILVADGPLTGAQEEVLKRAQTHAFRTTRIDLPQRSGAGKARQAGLERATADLVAIADADDVSLPERLEVQAELLNSGAMDALGSAMQETDADAGDILGVRRLPAEHGAIVKLARYNNPINHPTLMFRRDAVLAVGGYRDVPWLEDYDLMIRLIGSGVRLHNTQQVLVKFRGGAPAQRRRRGGSIARSEWELQCTLRDQGLISRLGMIRNWALRNAYRSAPESWRMALYRRMFLREADIILKPDRPEYDRHVDMSEVRGPLGEAFALQALRTSGISDAEAASMDVLDVGSGYGDTGRALAKRCQRVTCLEPARELHERAQAQATAESIDNMQFVHGGVEGLDLENAFDLIVLDNVYEHLPAQPEALALLWRALRPGGRLYLLTPNKLWPIEAHYHLPGLAWLPLPVANLYLRASGRGRDYTDASYAPTYWGLRRLLDAHGGWDYGFALPGDPSATVAGQPWHYRTGMAAIKRYPSLWAISKALLVVATKRPCLVSPDRAKTPTPGRAWSRSGRRCGSRCR